ncbi:MAG: hypothetical protein HN904_24155, partial [Victivallales bacterium]|nr:hypothetical protein [Victivallales bacterium]
TVACAGNTTLPCGGAPWAAPFQVAMKSSAVGSSIREVDFIPIIPLLDLVFLHREAAAEIAGAS